MSLKPRVALAAVIALAGACGLPQRQITLRDLVIGGSQLIYGVGSTRQFTVSERLSDFTTKAVTSPVQWSSSDPSVFTTTPAGVITTLKIGDATLTASTDDLTSRLTIQVLPIPAPIPTSLSVLGSFGFSAAGQTNQFDAVARFNDGTSKDVTADATWTSADPTIADFSAPGLIVTHAIGQTTVTVKYQGLASTNSVTVAPPGTLIVSGRVRLPGAGQSAGLGVPGFLITDTATGAQVISNSQGQYSFAVSVGDHLHFEKDGYEPADLTATSVDGSVTVQQLYRIDAGGTVTTTVAPNDIIYDPSPSFHCGLCRLIRVVCPSSGTLHLVLMWTESFDTVTLWVNGATFSPAGGARTITADIPVTGGETQIYVKVTGGEYEFLTLVTSMTGGDTR